MSPLLVEALEVALRAAAITDGDVDPTVGRAMGELGYDRDFSLVAGGAPRGPACGLAPVPRMAHGRGWTARAAPSPIPRGVRIDLGATAKALAADRAARAVHEATGAGTLVSLGGDIALCGESPAGDGRSAW